MHLRYYCTYTTYDDDTPRIWAVDRDDSETGITDDWDEYVWHLAASPEQAIEQHPQKMREFLADPTAYTEELF